MKLPAGGRGTQHSGAWIRATRGELMAVKMRLMRMGKTKSPYYRVVVIDGRAPRDGRYIDLIGRYDPRENPSVIEIDNAKAIDWLRKGAQPTEAVSKILDVAGALTAFKVKSGRIHTVGGGRPDAPSEVPVADEPASDDSVETATETATAPEASADDDAESTAETSDTAEDAVDAGSEEE
ncbi:MAG: 30S ribosomal protein S16 [Acidimicrobiia bacterium]